MGPTAAGKTAVALELARHLRIHLISVDSMLVYRGFNIGSAKPTAATLELAPHALIDVRDFWLGYSAAEFRHDALKEIELAHRLGAMPVLVGGTGLYFRALQNGLSNLPNADPAVRATLARELETLGAKALHARLLTLDPIAAARIDPNDPQRITRALEVIHLSGKRLSELHGSREPSPIEALKFAICPEPRERLHARIFERTQALFAQGLIDEVRSLSQHPKFDAQLPAFRAVGYRQALEHLNGDYDLAECQRRVLYATRQYAKRQLTWLRAEPHLQWLQPEEACAKLLPALGRFINGEPTNHL